MSERIELTIEKLVHGGSGLGRLANGQAVFVSGVLPSERVLVELRRRRKGMLEAALIAVLEPSPDRSSPPCSGETQCTGATWPHIAYPAQLRFKREILLETLAKIGGLSPSTPLPILPSPRIDHYRLRTQFTVRSSGGRQQIGFFRQGTYDLIEVDDAFLLDPAINRTLKAIRSLEPHLPPLNEIHINAAPSGDVHLLFWGGGGRLPPLQPFFEKLRTIAPQVIGITVYADRRKTLSLGGNQLLLENNGVRYKATEGNFFQVNWEQNRSMVKTVLDFAGLTGSETVLDLYCGIGNFALPLAGQAKTVIGIEAGYSAIDDAKANAALNNISNAEFIADDLQKGLKTLMQRKLRAEVIVLDPPRSGATLKTVERVLAFVPQKIVYVSCNPATLARDLKFFHLFGFRLERLQPVDMFPYTYHIECVAEMVRT
jgi:23S rRNA (uracil1939-C5)-methyltransferase